jgi:Zn-dependent peptidase ImmA (M78 family)/plasmid maintenance system antidote protein VapI
MSDPYSSELRGVPDPTAIILAREAAGYTQTALARRIGISQGTLSKVENDQQPASPEMVDAMARELGRPKRFFYQRLDHRNLPVTFFRKRKSLSQTVVRKATAKINILRLQVRTLLRAVEIPDTRVPCVDIEDYSGDAEAIATELRIQWHLPPGPVEDLTGLLESRGIIVVIYDFGTEKIDGLSMHYADDGLPPIIVLKPGLPGDRFRWTLAHELAHIVLHHHREIAPTGCEPEADRFASSFLMPASDIRGHLARLTLDKLAQLKPRWKVSMQSLIIRSHSLGQMTDRKKRAMFATMSRYGFRKKEPVFVPVEEPRMVRELIDTHKELGYSESELAEALMLSKSEFAAQYETGGLRLVH